MKIRKAEKIRSIIVFIVVIVLLVAFIITFFGGIGIIPSWTDIFPPKKVSADSTEDFVYFLDVGQGDATLFMSNGRFALIDTGDGDFADIGKTLKNHGVSELDAVIITHIDDDHFGGYDDVLRECKVKNLIVGTKEELDNSDKKNLDEILKLSEENSVTVHNPITAMSVRLGDAEITVLYYDGKKEESNDRSIVTMAECNGRKVLLTGDLTSTGEKELLSKKLNLDCDILKVAHHGSKHSTYDSFLSAAKPEFSVISVGKNSYGHPAEETLNRLKNANSKVYRTDTYGEIYFDLTDIKVPLTAYCR